MKQVSRYAGDGEGSEKMITYYKQLIVSKDCEINTFREKLIYFENLIYEKDESLEKMTSTALGKLNPSDRPLLLRFRRLLRNLNFS